MKRFLALLLCLMFCLCLLGCQQDTAREKDDDRDTDDYLRIRITTDSMEPMFAPGDTVYYREVDPHRLEVGDIILYWTVINGERIQHTSRIIAIYDAGNFLVFETKDDNRPEPNPLTVHENEILGKYVRIR